MAKIPKSDQSQNTNQRNKWANTDPRIYRRWDQVPRRSKHPLLTGRAALFNRKMKTNKKGTHWWIYTVPILIHQMPRALTTNYVSSVMLQYILSN
jgi:hypothetical protein